MSNKILVVDDDLNICELLKLYLENEGYTAYVANDGQAAVDMFNEKSPDLVLLDIMLPKMDGWQVCREIRKTSSVPIIMLTAKGETFDKVLGLELGADDYVTKPFSVVELLARVEALFRRVGGGGYQDDDSIRSGPFRLDTRSREVTKNGVKIELTQIEYGILKAFMTNVGRALSRDDILEMVWGHHYVGELKIVDVNIRRLRIKIEDNPASPRYIVTVRGYGYMWEG